MPRRDPAWQRAADVAASQRLLLTRAQCLQSGLTPTQVARACADDGPWQRVLPGVYAVVTGTLSLAQMAHAALLLAGPEAQLAGRTALEAYGLRYLPPSDGRVHVLVPLARQVRSRPLVRVHRTGLLPPPRWRAGMPCSPPEFAAVLACRTDLCVRDARAVLAEVVQRRLTTLERLEAVLAQGHSAGSALARRVLADLGAGCLSAPEMELRDLVSTDPVLATTVRWNHTVTLGDGTSLVADASWLEVMLIVEVDSMDHHGLGWTPELTARRRARLVAEGWTVLSVSPFRIRQDGPHLLSEIARTYRRLSMIHAASGHAPVF